MNAATFTPDMALKDLSVEGLIRYAARSFESVGMAYPPAKMSKFIRHHMATDGVENVKRLIDTYIGRRLYSAEWDGFERYAAAGYIDETGGRAAANVDRERGADR